MGRMQPPPRPGEQRPLREQAGVGDGVVEGVGRGGGGRLAVEARLHGQQPLPGRRGAEVHREGARAGRGQAETPKAGRGQHERVVVAARRASPAGCRRCRGPAAPPRRGGRPSSWAARRGLPVPTRAPSGMWSMPPGTPTSTSRASSRAGHGDHAEPLGEVGRQVLGRVDGQVGAAVEQRLLQLLDEQPAVGGRVGAGRRSSGRPSSPSRAPRWCARPPPARPPPGRSGRAPAASAGWRGRDAWRRDGSQCPESLVCVLIANLPRGTRVTLREPRGRRGDAGSRGAAAPRRHRPRRRRAPAPSARAAAC